MKGMSMRLVRKRYLLGLGIVLLGLLVVAPLLSSRGLATSSTRVSKVVKSEDLGAWAYRATLEEDGWTMVWVDWKESTPAGLKGFVAANREMGQALSTHGRSFHSIVTFKQPLNAGEFTQMILDARIPLDRINGYTMRGVSAKNRWWAGGKPSGGVLIDENTNRGLEDIRRHDTDLEVLGVVYFDASLTPDEYQRLAKDERVALIDVTQDIVRDRLSKVREVDQKKLGFATGSPYYQIEQFGADALP